METDGSSFEVLAGPQQSPYGIAVAPQHVYWGVFLENGFVGRVPVLGGPVETWVGSCAKPRDLAVQGDSLIWAEAGQLIDPPEGGVYQRVLSGSEPPVTLAVGDFAATSVEVDDDYVYWVDATAGAVMRTDLGGGSTIELAQDQVWEGGLHLHDQHLYWPDVTDGEIVRLPLAGGSPEVLATAQYQPFCVAADDSWVYWATHSQNGQILRAALP